MKRKIVACSYEKWSAAQAKLNELRVQAFEMVEPVFKRLQKSVSDELNAAAVAAEQRLDAAGIPIRNGDV